MNQVSKIGNVKATTASPPITLQPVKATPKLPPNHSNFFSNPKNNQPITSTNRHFAGLARIYFV
jgi:hypothetical protein